MKSSFDYRDAYATGNAAGLQKLAIGGFSEETQTWAWKVFKTKAKHLSRQNHFTEEEWTSMEAEALVDLLGDTGVVYEPASGKTVEAYLRGVIGRKLKHAAAKVADERSVWTESRRSLDAGSCSDEATSSLGDLVTDEATLANNRKLIKPPRAVEVRNTIKRLRNAKDRAGLVRFRAQLTGLDREVLVMESDESAASSEEDAGVDALLNPNPVDDFADDSETLNRSVFSARDHHAKAVAEVGLVQNEDDEVPQTRFRVRSSGFGQLSATNSRIGLKGDVAGVLSRLPPLLRDWCHRVKDCGEHPVEAYKSLGIPKNDYYKKVLPQIRVAFAELEGAY